MSSSSSRSDDAAKREAAGVHRDDADPAVSFRIGNMFSVSKSFPRSIRLCVAKLDRDDLARGGALIGGAIAKLLHEKDL